MMAAAIPEITRNELKAKMDRNDKFVLLEALPEEYYRRSHLPGAVNLPYEEAAEKAAAILPDKEADIVVYCMNRT